jgi:hypothetical protein
MRIAAAVTLSVLSLSGLPHPTQASHETPTAATGCQLEPYARALGGTMLDSLYSASQKQGFVIDRAIETMGGLNPEYGLDDFASHLEWGHGVFGIGTVGSRYPDGMAVEVYEYTPAGRDARSSAYEIYLLSGYNASEIFMGEKPGFGYHIGIFPSMLSQRFQSAGSIAYAAACYSMDYDDAWFGAREVLGYDDNVLTTVVRDEADTFWARMNGQNGKTSRSVGAAKENLTLSHWGSGNTTLSPVVEAYGPAAGTAVDADSIDAWITFDTRMDTWIDPSSVITGDSNLRIENERWKSGTQDTLRFVLRSLVAGTGCLTVNSLARSNGGMSLDGNQDPVDTDGVGPNRDPYVLCYDCTYTDPNYAASFASQWAYRRPGRVNVGWHLEALRNTQSFTIEGRIADHWTPLRNVSMGEVIAPGVYQVEVEDGHNYYRIVEIDKHGRTSIFRPMKVQEQPPDHLQHLMASATSWRRTSFADRAADRACRQTPLSASDDSRSTSLEHVPDWVFYGPDSLLDECAPAISWFQSKNMLVDTMYATSPDP